MSLSPLTRDVAAFATQLHLNDVPASAIAHARVLIADYAGTALAAQHSDVARLVIRYVKQTTSPRAGMILGDGDHAPVAGAALANGTLAHALDLDDDEPVLMIGHPSAPVLSALFSLCHVEHPAGKSFLAAFIVGVESEIAIGAAVNPAHYTSGWHATSTIGALGASLACSRLATFDEATTRTVLGIAASSSAGLKRNFGTMTKPLHVGRAAETAVVARDLAAAGLTANQSILDGPFGLLDMWSGDLPRAEQRVAQLGQRYGLEDPGVAIKRYPSCSNTHPAVDALLELRAEGLVAEDVARIICRVAPGTETILQYERPQSPLQAKFSMHYCLAAALVRGKLWIDDFEPDAVNDSDVGRIIDRVELVLDPDLAIGSEGVSTAAEVSVETNDGGRFVRRAGTPHGSRSSPLTLNELRNKFGMCAEPVLEDRVDAVFDRLLAIDDENDVASLLNELAPRGG